MKNNRFFKILILVILIISISFVIYKSINHDNYSNESSNKVDNHEIIELSNPDTINDNGAYYNNLNFQFGVADPTIIQHDGCLYVFATDYKAFKSCDSKNWVSHSFKINGNVPKHNYLWAPEIHKIGNYYYLIFTLVTWGSGYPWAIDSFGSVYYARSKDLTNFEYLGELPYGSDYFTGKVDNKNHIDGSLLIDGNKYYHYYKLECMDKTIPNNDVQELYGVELSLNNNGTFSQVGNPILIIRRNKETNPVNSNNVTWTISNTDIEPINEGPYVIKKNNKYYLTFSSGVYNENTYRVEVATSNSPLGPFVRDKIGNKPRYFIVGQNYVNVNSSGATGDSSKYIYGPGHGALLKLSFSDSLIGTYDEYYYAYHSIIYSSGKFVDRKLNIDGVNFDSSGNMFVNGPTIDNQPLISGSKYNGVTYYKVPSVKYNSGVLTDGIKYTSKSIVAKTLTTNEISLSFNNNERIDLTDIWVYGDGNNLGTVSGTIYINNSNSGNFSIVSSGSSLKIPLPSINEKVRNIKIVYNRQLVLTEIELIRNSLNNYYLISFNGNGAIVSSSKVLVTYNDKTNNKIINIPTKSGYKFIGWYTLENGGDLIYKSDGSYNASATSYWNSNGNWIYKNDVTLYAHWEKAVLTGDVDGNGTVGISDYILVRKHILSNPALTGDALKRADVNSDGKVTILDYIDIRKIIMGIK